VGHVLRGEGIQFHSEATMIAKIKAIKRAMSVGEMLENPIPLKDKQSMSGLVVAVIGAALVVADAFFGYSLDISDEQVSELGGMVGGILVAGYGLFNYVATLATSQKVGLQGKSKPDAE
jgi:hypothetical protein